MILMNTVPVTPVMNTEQISDKKLQQASHFIYMKAHFIKWDVPLYKSVDGIEVFGRGDPCVVLKDPVECGF